MKKLIIPTLLIFLLGFLSIVPMVSAQSFNYTKIDFIDGAREWQLSYIQLYSPARTDNPSINRFPLVTSKNNDPRSVGTTPHEGVDLSMNVGEEVYPIYDGTIAYKSDWKVAVKISNDTYASYLHLTPKSTLTVDTPIRYNELIGTIASKADNGGYNVHLHWGLTTAPATDTNSIPTYYATGPRYKAYGEWFVGHDLDHISDPKIDSNNVLTLYSYAKDDGHTLAHEKVELWYHKGDGNWTSVQMDPMNFYYSCPIESTSEKVKWSIDLDTIASSGETVYWYAAGYRDRDSSHYDTYNESIEPHNWGLFPAKYSHPDVNGNNFPSSSPPAYNITYMP